MAHGLEASPSPVAQPDENRTEERTHRVQLAKEVVALLLGVATTWYYLMVHMDNVNEIDRPDAVGFLEKYWFATAVNDPELALETLTTDNFRQIEQGDGMSFKSWWDRVESIDDVSVSDMVGGRTSKNRFDVTWQWNFSDDRPSVTSTARVTLYCASWWGRYVPTRSCDPEDIRLDDSQRVEDP